MKGFGKQKEEPSRVPETQPMIKEFNAFPMPGTMPGTLVVMVFGLGEDGKMYQWDGKDRHWLWA